MLQQCQSKHIADHLCRADASVNALPFKSAHFDLVLAGSVLEYIDDPVSLLTEIERVLKPGLFFIIAQEKPQTACLYQDRTLNRYPAQHHNAYSYTTL